MLEKVLIEKYRPKTIDDLVLSDETREIFDNLDSIDAMNHILLVGVQGTGKTSLAKAIVEKFDATYRYINASDERGIDTIRDTVVKFASTKSLTGQQKIIILDEADGLTKDAQRSLRNVMETHITNVKFILTANYLNRIIEPLRSRSWEINLVPPLKAVGERIYHIIKSEGIEVPKDQKKPLKQMIVANYPDIRSMVKNIQRCNIGGVLKMSGNDKPIDVSGVYNRIVNGDVVKLRQYYLDNIVKFNGDYHTMLKALFDHFYVHVNDKDKKMRSMIVIGEHMLHHQTVMDPEINAYCCLMKLIQLNV